MAFRPDMAFWPELIFWPEMDFPSEKLRNGCLASGFFTLSKESALIHKELKGLARL